MNLVKKIFLMVFFGRKKFIPSKYAIEILNALSHYPELKKVKIVFKTVKKSLYPYSSRPAITSFFKVPSKRKYIVTFQEMAAPPVSFALLKNLPQKAKVGILGHELGHVIQYNSMNIFSLFKTAFLFLLPSFRRKMERHADKLAIAHGLGAELFQHAVYIRSIPGYTEKRKEINRNYLKLQEILQELKNRKV